MDYRDVMKKATKDKASAELRLAAATLNHGSACMLGDRILESKLRNEIHALQDIILDATAVMYECADKLG